MKGSRKKCTPARLIKTGVAGFEYTNFIIMTDLNSTTDQQRRLHKRLYLGSVLLGLVLIFGVILLFFRQNKSIAAETNLRRNEILAGPVVRIVPVATSLPQRDLTVIGEARPFFSVTLYAKISGYLKTISVDKGDQVRQGEVLATIESPETDQEYISALADAQNKLKIWERDSVLVLKDYVSQEQEEESQSSYKQAEAYLHSLKDILQYKDLIAPFDGTVTARYADPGALMQDAANAQTSALPVVTISQLSKLRVYVYVDQKDAEYLKDGYPVDIGLDEKPELKIPATITRIAGELDPTTRMMLTEIDITNRHDTIVPGSFVQVHIKTPIQTYPMIPVQALVIHNDSDFVATVNASRQVHFVPIKTGTNDGQNIQVLQGISMGDSVLLNAGANINEGQQVRTIQ